MITAFRKKVTVRSDGRIEIKSTNFKPGAKAEVIVLMEDTDAERQKRVRRLNVLFKTTQALPQAKTITEEDIAAEIAAYRAGNRSGQDCGGEDIVQWNQETRSDDEYTSCHGQSPEAAVYPRGKARQTH